MISKTTTSTWVTTPTWETVKHYGQLKVDHDMYTPSIGAVRVTVHDYNNMEYVSVRVNGNLVYFKESR